MIVYTENAANIGLDFGMTYTRIATTYAHNILEKIAEHDLIYFEKGATVEAGRTECTARVLVDGRIQDMVAILYCWVNKRFDSLEGLVVLKNDMEGLEFACTCMAFQTMDVDEFMGIAKKIYG